MRIVVLVVVVVVVVVVVIVVELWLLLLLLLLLVIFSKVLLNIYPKPSLFFFENMSFYFLKTSFSSEL